MKDFIIKTLYSLFDFCLPYRYATRAKVALVVMFSGDWQFAPGSLTTEGITSISSEELQEKLAGIGEENLAVAEQYIKMLHFFSVPMEFRSSYIYRINGLLSKYELAQHWQGWKQLKKLSRDFVHFPILLPETLIHHHGLKDLPETVHKYMLGGDFLDLGAYKGDSSLIFSKYYFPGHIYAFEPSKKNSLAYEKNMQRNGYKDYTLIVGAVGNTEEEQVVYFDSEEGGTTLLGAGGKESSILNSLDNFSLQYNFKPVLIKADLEGMGLEMLLGAEKTIKENRPVLSLSIYHSKEEFLEIYANLKKWDLNYKFKLHNCGAPVVFAELSLIAYPAELD